MPTPRPIRRQCARWDAVASRRRGNHVKGAETSRPSARTTRRASAVNETSRASGSTLTVEVLTPSLQEKVSVLHHDCTQLAQFVRPKAPGTGQRDGIEPELGVGVVALDVDVRRLVVLAAVEEEPVWTNAKDSRHLLIPFR